MTPKLLLHYASLAIAALVFSGHAAIAAPVAFWVGDPVGPGQTVLVYGDGFAGCTTVHWKRLPDKPGAGTVSGDETPAQTAQRCVKFMLPANVQEGIFQATIKTPSGATTIDLDRPQVTWAQGDAGTPGTPGGWVRVCGKCLNTAGRASAVALSDGRKTVTLIVTRAEPFTIEARLPATLHAGVYMVSVSSGLGMSEGWSSPIAFKVIKPKTPPPAVFEAPAPVDTPSGNLAGLQKVLDQAGAHGGIVRLHPGRWLLDGGLTMPRNVTLQGAGMNRTALCWVDMEAPPDSLILGSDHFKIADLSLYARNYRNCVVADQTTQTAGHVTVDRVRMRLNPFRNHLKQEQIAARGNDTHRSYALKLGGEDVEIVGCDVYAFGFPIFLSRATGSRVFDNQFYIGRKGSYFLAGSNGLLFERNLIAGTDMEAGGGGVDNLDGSSFSQNVYFANNTVKSLYSGDHEGMTADGPGSIYDGAVASVSGAHLVLAGDTRPFQWIRDWTGAGVFIMGGKGQGEYRRITAIDGRNITVDSPWSVDPDSTSVISITILSRNYIFVDNAFIDTGVALAFYGSSVGHIAYGNVSERGCGFYNFGMNYHGAQPSWYIEWLGNKITDGTTYMGGPDSRFNVAEAPLAVQGNDPRLTPKVPATLGVVVRGNDLQADAHIEVRGTDNGRPFPFVRDVIVEDNHVSNSEVGLSVGLQTEGVLSHANRFTNCAVGLHVEGDLTYQGDHFEGCGKNIDDGRALLKVQNDMDSAIRARLAREPGPTLHLTFDDTAAKGVFQDVTGNGFDASVIGNVATSSSPHGRAADFDGKSGLMIAHPGRLEFAGFTFSCWVKPASSAGNGVIASRRHNGGSSPFILVANDDKVLVDGSDSAGEWWKDKVLSASVLKAGVWTHIGVVEDSAGSVSLYLDGRLAARAVEPYPHFENSEPLMIGIEPWWPPFHGSVADVRLWMRSLSPDEIAGLAATAKKTS